MGKRRSRDPRSYDSSKKVLRGRLGEDLRFYNPREVYNALTSNKKVVGWLKFIAESYTPPPEKKVLLFYPCSTVKPYHESRSYKALYKTLESLGEKRRLIHVVAVSEPFGAVPEEYFYEWEEWYDCPGLFEWWCRAHGQPYEREYAEKSIELLASYVAAFLKRTKSSYAHRVAFVRTYTSKLRISPSHTHRRIIELASKASGVEVELLPPKEVVEEIVRTYGAGAWNRQGVAHPAAQEYLRGYLERLLVRLSP
ncbi:DUF5591 domain-containing protein [Thermofilum pendens]|uniref:Queuine tRNA-ribosyltransferases contain PUA domain-like protein n=1 Tax=Thermofilum pendens (strain DSM 2475 / Hrk 5) TaxID=368408 RepID=A1RZP7_THEPD|nr:DUF5591 domain-containing protein [Thermofilum pendens]ABL78677.1 Queuine tRNA-ribosyltransferases contain PUA domain-like protein [Thermofilum pendens Hrk 5]